MLNLTRPLIWIDLETTGISPQNDRIWEIGLIKAYPEGKTTEWETLVYPGMPLPKIAAEMAAKRGITDEVLSKAPTFRALCSQLHAGFENCDFAGYNVRSFDLPFLAEEFARAGRVFSFAGAKVIDAFRLDTKVRPRNLTNYVKEYLGEDFTDAHQALKDIQGTYRGFHKFLEKFHHLPRTVNELHEFTFGSNDNVLAGGKFYRQENIVFVNFGKYRGQPISKCATEYLEWVCTQSFEPEVKQICAEEIKSRA